MIDNEATDINPTPLAIIFTEPVTTLQSKIQIQKHSYQAYISLYPQTRRQLR